MRLDRVVVVVAEGWPIYGLDEKKEVGSSSRVLGYGRSRFGGESATTMLVGWNGPRRCAGDADGASVLFCGLWN